MSPRVLFLNRLCPQCKQLAHVGLVWNEFIDQNQFDTLSTHFSPNVSTMS